MAHRPPILTRPWPQHSSVAITGRPPMVGPGKGVGSASGGFPALSGLIARYRADLGVTLSGSTVSKWADQSGNGRDLTEATNQPLWVASLVNGMPAIRFDGSNDKLVSAAFSIAAPQTMVMVAKLLGSFGVVASLGNASGPDLFINGTGKLQLEKSGTSGTDNTVGTGYFAMVAVADASASTFQINNGASTSVINISGTAVEVALGGRSGGGSFGNIEIAEFIALSGDIGANDLAALLAYLKSVYALW